MKKFKIMTAKKRSELAKQGKDEELDILVHDKDNWVRKTVAEQGRTQDLDILVHDESPYVRSVVAKQGRDEDLDILVNDEDWSVRCAVANYGREKDLDILVHDSNWTVRRIVAAKGRSKDLDILVNDSHIDVRKSVAQNGREKDLDILVFDNKAQVRAVVARLRIAKYMNILSDDNSKLVQKTLKKYGYGRGKSKIIYKKVIEKVIDKELTLREMLEECKEYSSMNFDDLFTREELAEEMTELIKNKEPFLEIAECLQENPDAELFEYIPNETPIYCFPVNSKADLKDILLKEFPDEYKEISQNITILVEELCEISPLEEDEGRKTGIRTVLYQSNADNLFDAIKEYQGVDFDMDNVIESNDDFAGECLDLIKFLSFKEV